MALSKLQWKQQMKISAHDCEVRFLSFQFFTCYHSTWQVNLSQVTAWDQGDKREQVLTLLGVKKNFGIISTVMRYQILKYDLMFLNYINILPWALYLLVFSLDVNTFSMGGSMVFCAGDERLHLNSCRIAFTVITPEYYRHCKTCYKGIPHSSLTLWFETLTYPKFLVVVNHSDLGYQEYFLLCGLYVLRWTYLH